MISRWILQDFAQPHLTPTTAQVNELLAKIVAYNLTVVIHEMCENGINPDFLHLKSNLKAD